MAVLTTERLYETEGSNQNSSERIIKSGVKVFNGSFVGVDKGTGHVESWVNTASSSTMDPVWLGRCNFQAKELDSNGENSLTGDGVIRCTVIEGETLRNVSIADGADTDADVGKYIHMSDDNVCEFAIASNEDPTAVVVARTGSALYTIRLFTQIEALALIDDVAV